MCFDTDSENFNDKKNKVNLEKKETITEDDEKKAYELRTGELLTCLRIEYELLPKKLKYYIDITCWRNLAKVSTSDAFHYYKTLESGECLWIPITIHHFVKEISEEELVNLHSHTITFNIMTTKKDVTSKVSCLYCWKDEVEKEKCVEYFEADPNKSENNHEKIDETTEFMQMSNKCNTSEGIASWLKFRGKTHCYMVYDTISSVEKGYDIKYKEFIPPSELSMETKEEGKTKSKKQEEKKRDPYFVVPGEVFFADPKRAIYKLREPNSVLKLGYAFLTVKNLMTREQKASLSPFIVKIKKLDCIPVELLKEHGYKELFISYDIPCLAKYDSPPKPTSRTIHFNESNAFFTKDLPKYKYLQFIRTERVRVHINGIREEQSGVEPALFGTRREDENFSKILQPRQAFHYFRKKENLSKIQLLAIATYDLSSLLKNVWTFRQEAPCYHPDNLLHGITERGSIKLVDIITIPEINLADIDREKSTSPLFNGILASELTTLEMEFCFLEPQVGIHHGPNIRTYKRFFITFYDSILAQQLLASILQHNQNLIGIGAVLVDPVHFSEEKVKIELRKRRLSDKRQVSDESLKNELKGMLQDSDDVITGFSIDNGKEVHIFVEGISYGYILEVWNKIHKVNTFTAKVFLNSETEFEKRMYQNFMVVGIYPITLKMSLEKIFQNQDIYVQGMIPIPCFKALMKLSLLLKTETLGEMLQQELFPSSNELVSLNFEFGVPLRYCDKCL